MLANPAAARQRLLECRNACVDARNKLRIASQIADLDHAGTQGTPERLSACRALLKLEEAISELSQGMAYVARDVARRAPSEVAK